MGDPIEGTFSIIITREILEKTAIELPKLSIERQHLQLVTQI
jgi:hypothetical protein